MIEKYEPGRMRIQGRDHRKDLKIIGGQVVAGWWRNEGHRLGLKDIEDILASDPDVIVMGTGYAGRMRVEEDVRSLLQDRNIRLIAAPTEEAVRKFNQLASERNDVAAGFHLTC
jgi:hypothetical protein